MNLRIEKTKLVNLIGKYSNGQASLAEMNKYAWSIIDYFTKTSVEQLPPKEGFETEFWYTIWQIQHLADEAHEQDDVVKNTLLEALSYLEGRKKMPSGYIGMRPHS